MPETIIKAAAGFVETAALVLFVVEELGFEQAAVADFFDEPAVDPGAYRFESIELRRP